MHHRRASRKARVNLQEIQQPPQRAILNQDTQEPQHLYQRAELRPEEEHPFQRVDQEAQHLRRRAKQRVNTQKAQRPLQKAKPKEKPKAQQSQKVSEHGVLK